MLLMLELFVSSYLCTVYLERIHVIHGLVDKLSLIAIVILSKCFEINVLKFIKKTGLIIFIFALSGDWSV